MVIPLVPAIAEKAVPKEPVISNAQKRCEGKGGVWDEVTKTCKLPEEEKIIEAPKIIPPTPETFTDPETGRATGITTPGGKTFLGLSPDEVAQVAAQQAGIEARPAGTQPVGTFAQQQADIQRKLQLASQVGQIDFATAQQLDELGINWKEAFLAGTAGTVKPALTFGATAGAASLVGGPLSIPVAAAGAGVGAISGFYSGVTSNIKAQKGDLISGKRTELKQRQRAMMNYISAANANPANAEEMVLAYNIEKSLIRKDYNSLNKESNEDLTLFGGQDGTPQLIAYEIYFESVEPSLDLRMNEAVLKPDPTRAYLSTEDFE